MSHSKPKRSSFRIDDILSLKNNNNNSDQDKEEEREAAKVTSPRVRTSDVNANVLFKPRPLVATNMIGQHIMTSLAAMASPHSALLQEIGNRKRLREAEVMQNVRMTCTQTDFDARRMLSQQTVEEVESAETDDSSRSATPLSVGDENEDDVTDRTDNHRTTLHSKNLMTSPAQTEQITEMGREHQSPNKRLPLSLKSLMHRSPDATLPPLLVLPHPWSAALPPRPLLPPVTSLPPSQFSVNCFCGNRSCSSSVACLELRRNMTRSNSLFTGKHNYSMYSLIGVKR